MSGFFRAPQFLPIEPPLQNGSVGQVLTISAAGKRVWAAGGGGGSGIGTYYSSAPAAGVYNDVALAAGVGRWDIDTTAGNVEITGIALSGVADADLLIVSNIGPNLVLLDSLDSGSSAANRMRLIGQIALPQYAPQLLCYYGGSVNKWCAA